MWLLMAQLVLMGCGTQAPAMRGRPTHFAQTMDSATSACIRTPACYAATGEDAVLPWLTRAASAARTATAVLRLVSEAELQRIEVLLLECAKQAHFQVNERMFGPGKRPTREQCEEVVKNPWNQEVKLAVELGRLKHEMALECARKELEERLPGNYSLEPRYGYDAKTKQTRLISREQVEEWLQAGWLHLLLGTLVPDVVIHETGNPLKVQAVYDFKFPCHASTDPSWHRYPPNHPYQGFTQGDMYQRVLKVDAPAFVSPNWGITR
jgi:hypothetical protein